MTGPSATYRLQFSPEFTFADAERIVPYLSRLGVSHIYASPILRPRTGSTHGYDVVDHSMINPELGGMDGFRSLIAVAHDHGLGWIQDIVPNHMAFSPDNLLLADLFEHGERSRYRHFFDIDWNAPYRSMEGRVIAPFLGDLFGKVLDRGEITLEYAKSGFALRYYSMRFPLRIESYLSVLTPGLARLERELGRDDPRMLKLLGALYSLESLEGEPDAEIRSDKTGFAKRMLWELYQSDAVIRAYIDRSRDAFNGTAGDPESFTALNELHWNQVYRLAYWKVASEEINYRRFFSVNDLICMRAEDPEVFHHSHRLLFELVEEGAIDGLRIDHIDGLYEPGSYLARLRERIGDRPIYVEKILHPGEKLPDHWQTDGTTGYDSLNLVHGLFVHPGASRSLVRTFRSVTGDRREFASQLFSSKRRILEDEMAGDLDTLARYMRRVIGDDRYGIDITLPSLKRALAEVMVHFPVYRTYSTDRVNRERDREYVATAMRYARASLRYHDYEFDYIERVLLLDYNEDESEELLARWSDLVQRFQQYTGPLMAKGLEDTLMYSYAPLLSVNEVGGDPDRIGVASRAFHAAMAETVRSSPGTLVASSTHDTKRGEDTRLRISALSLHPTEWGDAIRNWRALNRTLKQRVNGTPAPDATDEYFIYQSILGALGTHTSSSETLEVRLGDYLVKALREAKRHTSWITPNAAYEEAATLFQRRLLEQLRAGSDTPFAASFRGFHGLTRAQFELSVIAHLAVRMTVPGVPDVYQGTEFLDLTLVDPDNRRQVDWEARERAMARTQEGSATDDGTGLDEKKLRLLSRLLQIRRDRTDLFRNGSYVPLDVTWEGGANTPANERAIAFARVRENEALITVARRFMDSSVMSGVHVPEEVPPGRYRDLLSGETVDVTAGGTAIPSGIASRPATILTNW